ncbi:MAG TPA: FG-GAP repeat protein, partial [Micromonosporaceae bacterium]|nr:FG-GAP repeat protein [Micromonosporaceae bacterium]
YFSQSTDGVPGTRHDGELFGWSLTAGDVSGDGRDDLAVGAIYDWDDLGWSTGSVTMLYGGADGLTGTGAQRWSKDTTGVPGSGGSFDPETDDDSDLFGYQVVLADINGDGRADLATAAPGAPVTVDGVRKRDAGTLTVLYAGDGAISSAGAVEVSQQDTGMPGVAGQEDHLGVTLAGGDVTGDGAAELALYSDGDGYVTVIPGGLSFDSAQGWTQNSDGIPGASEPGDEWGNSLRFADVAGTGMASLVVGADGENTAQGAFTVIPGTSTGLTGVGSRYFSQNTAGVPGTAENGDRFGAFY